MSKKEWELRVVLLLYMLDHDLIIDKSEISKLIQSYLMFIKKREMKHESKERRSIINKITSKEKIAVNKLSYDKIKQLIDEINKL